MNTEKQDGKLQGKLAHIAAEIERRKDEIEQYAREAGLWDCEEEPVEPIEGEKDVELPSLDGPAQNRPEKYPPVQDYLPGQGFLGG